MSIKNWPGGRISSTPPTPSGPFQNSTASGVWTLDQVAYWRSQNQWPTAGNPPPDPDFEYVTLLLHGDGTNGGQNNTFLDSSTNNFTITRNGNTTQGSFSPYGPNWSNYFDGSGDYLTTATSASAFSFGTGDFTIEFWINSTQTARCDPVGQDTAFSSSGWWGLIGNLSSSGQLQWFENANSRISATATNWNNGSWNHIAVTRSGNSVRMFVNGTQVGSTYTTSFTYGASNVGVIAGVLSDDKTTGPLTGYLSNLRIVKGTALYTGTFTPSTTPLTAVSGTSLLTCADNRFIDDSTNNFTISVFGNPSVQRFSPFAPPAAYSTATIGGSGYFDGAGDYLTTGTTSALAFGTGDFTTECWVYLPTNASLQSIFNINQFNTGILVRYDNSSNGYALFLGGTQYNSGVTTVGQWVHLAAARASGTVRFFVNGVQTNSASNTYSVGNANFTAGTAAHSLSETMTGYISNFRAVNGTAVYTAAFTPPTAPVTAITNTQLLTNFTNGAIFDNAMMNDLETVGNAQISTSVKKFGTGSMYFAAAGSYLVAANSPNVTLGSGDWTMECWIYSTDTGGVKTITAKGFATNGGFLWWVQSGELRIRLYDTSGGQVNIASAAVISANVWYHLAAVRNSNTVTLYVNGTSVASGTYTSALTSASNFEIGAYNAGTGNFQGYIDDLRITKGVARYTANFTPPTAAFPDI